MPRRISHIHRITLAVSITIQPTLSKWTQTIRAIKAHQIRIKSTIAITKQVVTSYWIWLFTIETQHTRQSAFQRTMTVWRISNGYVTTHLECGQYRA
ncbi:hypothetical protein D3C81_1771460 [compost metagenome]